MGDIPGDLLPFRSVPGRIEVAHDDESGLGRILEDGADPVSQKVRLGLPERRLVIFGDTDPGLEMDVLRCCCFVK